MSDLVQGHYPLTEEEWMLDGSPSQPYRRSISRRDIVTTGAPAGAGTGGVMLVVPVPCQQGDIIGAVSVGIATAAVGPTHAWAALYTGIGTAATLLSQSVDLGAAAEGVGALKFSLATPYQVGGSPGTPQGAAYTAGPSGPVALGVGIMFAASTTIPLIEGMTGGVTSSLSGLLTGQLPLAVKVGSGLTAAAPTSLSGAAAPTASFVPYVLLSRN